MPIIVLLSYFNRNLYEALFSKFNYRGITGNADSRFFSSRLWGGELSNLSEKTQVNLVSLVFWLNLALNTRSPQQLGTVSF